MINAAVFIAQPLDFQGLCKVYSPLVKDVVIEKNYPLYRKILTTSQEEIEDELQEKNQDVAEAPTPFEYVLKIAAANEEYYKIVHDAFKFFIKEEVSIVPENKIIFIGDIQEELAKVKDANKLRMITEDNFFDLQNMFRISLNDKPIPAYDPNMDPRKKRMLALARYRDKVKSKKKDGIDFSTTLAAICCMGIGITPLNIGEISVGSVSVLMSFYQNKEKYELDIQSLLAGADKKKVKPKYWIKNLDEI